MSGDLDICRALPIADANRITGTHFTKAESRNVASAVFGCEYTNPAAGDLLEVSVSPTNGKFGYDEIVSILSGLSHPPKKISGVGDEAFSMPDPQGDAGSVGASAAASFGALYGEVFIKVGGLTYVSAAQGSQITNEIHDSM